MYECEECGDTFDKVAVYRGHMSGHARTVSEEELIDGLKDLAETLGHTPSLTEAGGKLPMSVTTYKERFGSWNDAIETAGLEPVERHDITEGELIEELQRLADELGRTPSIKDVREFGKWSAEPYKNGFGTMRQAQLAAGLEPNKYFRTAREFHNPVPKDDLKGALRELAGELGRPPTVDDMYEMGEYSPDSYQRYFGSWTAGLEAVGLEWRENMTGENHPRWNGGGYDYGKSWTFNKKEKIREKYDRRCQGCGKTEVENIEAVGMRLSVHHVHKARDIDDEQQRNDENNLVPMCHKCHPRWEGVPVKPELVL